VIHFLFLALCVAAIYFSCEWFVNAVEWLGQRLRIGKMAVGTILAAIGTALPESVVTLVAVTTGRTPETKDIGIGAALGGPLVLSTIAYGVTGIVILLVHRRRSADTAGRRSQPVGSPDELKRLAKDQQWFLPVFAVKVGLGLVAFAIKPVLGLAFFAVYAIYFWREIRARDDSHDTELEPLKFQPSAQYPRTWAVVAQTLVTVAVIFAASQFFVQQLDAIGPMLGLPSAVTALLLSPIATELPETLNAIIWVRQGKTPLALANISGSMMIQATVPSGLGILFTPWMLSHALLWSGAITAVAIVYLLVMMHRHRLTAARLAVVAGLYVVFAAGLVFILH